MSSNNLKEFAVFAAELAESARRMSLRHFRNLPSIEYKKDGSPVTVADRDTETVVRHLISDRYPEHSIVGEEHGSLSSNTSWSWVIDPIDGTRSFIAGKPTFGCLIALLYENRPMIGIIDMPALNERWTGIKGEPSVYNGSQCYSKKYQPLSEATIFATSIDMFNQHERTTFDRLSSSARFRNFGADCYAYGLLASGHTDIVMESDMANHDFLALVPVIEGSGGCITDWEGNPLDFFSGRQVLATANPTLHQECLSLIKEPSTLQTIANELT